ncbi:CCR4-NOT transcription complex subunit 9 [Enteropsectra breve]|nr:CCR4-NOT transcription complex subunit 9 [Enteropsectra breve]
MEESALLEKICDDTLGMHVTTADLERILVLVSKGHAARAVLTKRMDFVLLLQQTIIEDYNALTAGLQSPAGRRRSCIAMETYQQLLEDEGFRGFFVTAKLDYYIYPFLLYSLEDESKIAALKLFQALLQSGIPHGMKICELLPTLLKIVDSPNATVQSLALDVFYLILEGVGLDYAMQTLDRYQAIDVALGPLMTKMIFAKNPLVFKKILKIYVKMCEKPNVQAKLRERMPEGLESINAINMCHGDFELRALRKRFLDATKYYNRTNQSQ